MTDLQLSDNVNYISPIMFSQIMDYIQHKLKHQKLDYTEIQMLFKIAYHCGLRVNEVLKLKKNDFDFNLLEVNLGHTKTEERGRASIPQSFVPELQEFLANHTNNYLIFGVSRQTAYVWLMQIGKALSISALITPQSETREKTKTHIFRKSIGKDMLYKKAPLNIIQRKLRHNNINTTSEYLKIKLNDVKNWENGNL